MSFGAVEVKPDRKEIIPRFRRTQPKFARVLRRMSRLPPGGALEGPQHATIVHIRRTARNMIQDRFFWLGAMQLFVTRGCDSVNVGSSLDWRRNL